MPARNTRTGSVSAAIMVALAVALTVLPGCGRDRAPAKTGPQLQAAYLDACRDAKTVEPEEVCRTLKAVASWENDLEWQGASGVERVKVVTWTGKDYYDQSVGKEYTLPADANVWVTLAPEVKAFSEKNDGASRLRTEQLLGLPPDSGKTRFVEMRVSPSDLFRPSPDPEIIDHEAAVDFPTASGRFLSFSATTITEWDDTVGADMVYTYEQWFNHRRDKVYSGDNPYPWTRLGYTYDWGNPESEVGLSEFVLLGDATVVISSVTSNSGYLRKQASLNRTRARIRERSEVAVVSC